MIYVPLVMRRSKILAVPRLTAREPIKDGTAKEVLLFTDGAQQPQGRLRRDFKIRLV